MPRGAATPRCPLFIGTWTAPYTPVAASRTIITPTPSAMTWVANLAVYVPLWLPAPFNLIRFWWFNGTTVAVNADMGVYSHGGTLLAHSGTTVTAGASSVQYAAPTGGAILLNPGRCYFGFVGSGTTSSVEGTVSYTAAWLRNIGCVQQALGSALLPATMTPAAITNALFPFCGMTQTPSGF